MRLTEEVQLRMMTLADLNSHNANRVLLVMLLRLGTK
jgi:hypothetical protein